MVFCLLLFYIDKQSGGALQRPSSPLLNALREAVESVSNMEDFEKLEQIGAGFFAEVFKVSSMRERVCVGVSVCVFDFLIVFRFDNIFEFKFR